MVESKYETASHVSHNFLPDDSVLSRAPSSPSHLIPPTPLVKFNDLAAESRANSMNFTRHKTMQKLAGLSHFTHAAPPLFSIAQFSSTSRSELWLHLMRAYYRIPDCKYSQMFWKLRGCFKDFESSIFLSSSNYKIHFLRLFKLSTVDSQDLNLGMERMHQICNSRKFFGKL